MRQFHLLRRLAELGHEVSVVAPVRSGQEGAERTAESLRAIGVGFHPVRRPDPVILEPVRAALRDPSLLGAALWRPFYPWQFSVFWSWVRPRLEQLLVERAPDVVVFEHDDIAGWGASLGTEIPLVLVGHNVTWRLLEQRASLAKGARAAGLHLDAVRHRRYIRRSLPAYHGIVAVSDADAADFAALGAARVAVVPNGADVAVAPQAEPGGPPTLLFVGSMDHAPNPDGIMWFADEAWPEVRRAVPGARLVVVGRGPRAPVAGLEGRPGVDLVGEAPSLAPYFQEATVVIAPLRSGGGSRLKILEAMAARRAVVATSVGAEGIAVTPGEDIVLADDPRGLADACVKLLDDEQLRRRIAGGGHRLVTQRYDWRGLGDQLNEVLAGWAR